MSASTSTPVRRLGQQATRKFRFSPWLFIPLLLIVGAVGWLLVRSRTTTTAATTTTARVTRGTLSVSVSGSGSVKPTRQLSLAFPVAGTVTAILATMGDRVTAGQPLARLETRDLDFELKQAEANLKSAQARLAEAKGEGASDLDVASAEVSLKSAQAGLEKTVKGTTTAADIASAEASLKSAQAQLAELKAGPTADTLSSARARVEQAQLSMQQQRESLATAKLRAESQVTTAGNSLRTAQDAYSTVYWQNRQKEKSPAGLAQSDIDNEAAAQRSVQNAQESLNQAQIAYDQSKQDEVTSIQQATSSLKDAQTQLDTVLAGATEVQLAQAESQVQQAQSNLAKLRQGATAAEIVQAKSQVEQAQINLNKLRSPSSNATITSAEASLIQAEVAYEKAKYNREQSTLVAPFAGVVASVSLVAGEAASASTPVVLMDVSTLYVDLNLSETDASKVAVGKPVQLTFDALPDAKLEGKVSIIAPTATIVQNVATYAVRVSFDPAQTPIRVGMTASGAIITEEHSNVLLVPSRAVQTVGGSQTVMVRPAVGQPSVPVRVQTGLTGNGQTEIVRCADGSECLKEGDELVITTTTSTSTTTNQNRNNNFGPPGGGPFSIGR